MSPREGIFYAGIMAGIVIGVTFSNWMGWHHIVGLICGAVLGIGLGVVAERLFDRFAGTKSSGRGKPALPETRTVTCKNPICQWTGDPGVATMCPRCGRDLPNR